MFKALYKSGVSVEFPADWTYNRVHHAFKTAAKNEGYGELYCDDDLICVTGIFDSKKFRVHYVDPMKILLYKEPSERIVIIESKCEDTHTQYVDVCRKAEKGCKFGEIVYGIEPLFI